MQTQDLRPAGGANTRRRHPYGREFLPLYDVGKTPGKTGQRWKVYDATPPEEGGFTPGIVFPSQELLGMIQAGSLANGSRVVYNNVPYTVTDTYYLRRKDGRVYRAAGQPPELEEVKPK